MHARLRNKKRPKQTDRCVTSKYCESDLPFLFTLHSFLAHLGSDAATLVNACVYTSSVFQKQLSVPLR